MAARNRRKFLTLENINAGSTAAQTRDVGGSGRELATLNPQGAEARPAPAKPVDERERLSGRLPPFRLERFADFATCDSSGVEGVKLAEIIGLTWVPPSLSPKS